MGLVKAANTEDAWKLERLVRDGARGNPEFARDFFSTCLSTRQGFKTSQQQQAVTVTDANWVLGPSTYQVKGGKPVSSVTQFRVQASCCTKHYWVEHQPCGIRLLGSWTVPIPLASL